MENLWVRYIRVKNLPFILQKAPPEQLHVAFIVYVNDKYKQMYPETLQIISKNLQNYQEGHKNIPSDVISHSLLNCSGS
jgi:glucan phosphoethanolaminetransferase (alkaline phosphatase superfamily)